MNNFWKGLLFVRKCVGCGKALPEANADDVFCENCFREYRDMCGDVCPACGESECKCRCVPKNLRGHVGFAAHLFNYYGEMSKRIVYTLKLRNYPFLQRFLAKELSDLVLEAAGGDLSDFTVTFVPRKPRSIRVYGFDQAKILAKLSAERLELPLADVFTHARFSKVQKRLNRYERKENATHSYLLRSDFVRTTDRLLIFDDVMTSGSTLFVLLSLAKMIGFREVCVVCIAKTGWS